MSRGLNKVQMIGHLGQDPDVRTLPSGARVAVFSLATSRQWKGQDGQKQEKTDWHRLALWSNRPGSGLADIAEKYLKKGNKIYVEGRIEYRTWEDEHGQKRYSTEIVVRELLMLSTNGAPKPVTASVSAPKEALTDFPEALEEEDDDLPF